jgi:predicted RNA binding protein YcfA (HicA-like mRNA interferase family)
VPTKVREAIRLIESDGWYQVKTRGGHRQFKHPTKPGRVTVAGKGSDDLAPKTFVSSGTRSTQYPRAGRSEEMNTPGFHAAPDTTFAELERRIDHEVASRHSRFRKVKQDRLDCGGRR